MLLLFLVQGIHRLPGQTSRHALVILYTHDNKYNLAFQLI